MPTDLAPHILTDYYLPGAAPRWVSASSELASTWAAWKPFAGSDSLFWASAAVGSGWLQMAMEMPQVVNTYTITANPSFPAHSPKTWTLEGSNDNGVTWATVDTVASETGWSASEQRTYTCDTTTTAYNRYRINITVGNTAGDWVGFSQLYLYANSVTANNDFAPHNLTSAGGASASSIFSSSFDAWKAFNGAVDSPQYWAASTSTGWLQWDTGVGNQYTLDRYIIQVNSVPEPNRAPRDWKMQGSNNGSSWTDLDTQTSQTSWGGAEFRNYVLGSTSALYRYFRVDVSANNGDALLEIAELYLFGAVAPPPPGVVPFNPLEGFIR